MELIQHAGPRYNIFPFKKKYYYVDVEGLTPNDWDNVMKPMKNIAPDYRVSELEDGTYSWIYVKIDEDNKIFMVVKCSDCIQVGTKHLNMVASIQKKYGKEIYFIAAGEMKKEENKISINSHSGTYMRDLGYKYQKKALAIVKDLLNKNGVEVIIDYSLYGYVNDECFPITSETMKGLLVNNVVLHRFHNQIDSTICQQYIDYLDNQNEDPKLHDISSNDT